MLKMGSVVTAVGVLLIKVKIYWNFLKIFTKWKFIDFDVVVAIDPLLFKVILFHFQIFSVVKRIDTLHADLPAPLSPSLGVFQSIDSLIPRDGVVALEFQMAEKDRTGGRRVDQLQTP
jgi:hypothetical protein